MSDLFDIRDDGDGDEPGCLSELELDRLLAGDDDGGALRQRLEACEHCGERLAALERSRDAFLADRPPHLAAARIAAAAAHAGDARPGLWQRLRDWRIVAPLTAALTAAVILLIVLRGGGGDDDAHRDVVRLKGGERFSVLTRAADGAFRRVGDGEALAAGSELGFEAFCTDRCTLTLAGVSEAGEGYVVDRNRALPPATAHTPDFTVHLDDSPGAERFYAAFCGGELDPGDLVRALERAYPTAEGRRAIAEPRPVELDGCTLRTRLVRRAR